MGLDLLIKNGTAVDLPRYRAHVGVSDGRIVEISRVRATADWTIVAVEKGRATGDFAGRVLKGRLAASRSTFFASGSRLSAKQLLLD